MIAMHAADTLCGFRHRNAHRCHEQLLLACAAQHRDRPRVVKLVEANDYLPEP